MASRPEITAALTKATVMHFVRMRYGVYTELGLVRQGILRGDVVAINYKKHIVVVEVKSSYADIVSDSKWPAYLGLCDKFMFVVPQALWDSGKIKNPGRGAGVVVLDEKSGHLRSVVNAKEQGLMSDSERDSLIMRMAYRGDFTKRNVKQRTKVFL